MSRHTPNRNRTALVVGRSDRTPVETDEIEGITETAGYAVAATITQTGHPHPGTYLGRGKLGELSETVCETSTDAVVVDDGLTPSQHRAIVETLPRGTRLLDRHRLVLDVFEEGVASERAQLQVELARLRYDLPRLIESTEEGMLNRRTESGTRVYDVRDRIDRLERKLRERPDPTEQFRRRRREQGFDLVTLAGYTNAGKSTLLHRLADDLSTDTACDTEPDGVDSSTEPVSTKDETATVADRLFETLQTTTRRATLGGRPVLCTDTVGYVDDLPHDLIASFSATLSEAACADAVVVVLDASAASDRIRDRLDVSLGVLSEQGVERQRLVLACNKIDRLEEPAVGNLANSLASDGRLDGVPAVPISATTGEGVDALIEAVRGRLPTETATLALSNCPESMSLVSEAYDRVVVEDVSYEGANVRIRCRGRPDVVTQLRARADSIGEASGDIDSGRRGDENRGG